MAAVRPVSWSRVRNRDAEGLTPRERACVDRERKGLSRERIAAELGIAVSTVAQHLWMAYQRGVKLRTPIKEQGARTFDLTRYEELSRSARLRKQALRHPRPLAMGRAAGDGI